MSLKVLDPLPGWPGNMTSEQENMLRQFQEKMADSGLEQPLLTDEHYMTRWLRARDYKLKDAEEMLKNNIEFRKRWRPDHILEEYDPPEVLKRYFVGGYAGTDRTGCPVFWDPQGYLDIKGLMRSAKYADLLKFKIRNAAEAKLQMQRLAKERGHRIDQVVIVYDLEKYGLKNLWKPGLDVAQKIVKIFEQHEPEYLKKVLVINAPAVFPIIYKILRPLLSEVTTRKVEVRGSDYLPALQQLIDDDNIPEHYGGTMVDSNGDPKCREWICFGGEVPESYYHDDTSVLEAENIKYVELLPGKGFKLQYRVTKPNAVLRYQFCTQNGDIGFGVCRYKEGDKKKGKEDLIPLDRVNSHMIPEDGTVELKNPGTYVVQFDNKYSWTRSKKLSYSVEVIEPLDVDNAVKDTSGNVTPEIINH